MLSHGLVLQQPTNRDGEERHMNHVPPDGHVGRTEPPDI